MRTVLCIFLLLTALLIYILSADAAETMSIEPWIRHNTAEILISPDQYLSDDEIIAHFQNLQEQFGVYLLQVIWRNLGHNIAIYTTDTSLDNKVTLSCGVFPKRLADGFLSNMQTLDAQQSGKFHYFTTQDREVLIYPIEMLAQQAGLEGIFYLNTTDSVLISEIITYLEASLRGSVSVLGIYGTMNYISLFAWTAATNLPWIMLLGVLCILFIFITTRYILSQSKRSSLMIVEGYSKIRVILNYLLEISPLFLLSLMLLTALIVIHHVVYSNIYFLWIFIVANLLYHILVFILFFFAAWFLISFQIIVNRPVKTIAGNKPSFALTSMQFFVKHIILIMIIVASLQLQTHATELSELQQANASWQQSKNVYTTVIRKVADYGNLSDVRPFEMRARQLFSDLSEEVYLFLIDASNFQVMRDGRYLWEWNSTDEVKSIYSLNGRTIIINENYLIRHPVTTVDGSLAREHLIFDPYVQNILIPVSLSSYKSDIYETFLNSFYFKSVDVSNLYNEELGNSVDDTPIEQFFINIIFVEDGIQYFTYNMSLATTTHNVIADPIVVVDTLNLDASYYSAWFTSSAFFESFDTNPLEKLRPHIVRNNLGASFSSVDSVFQLQANSIQNTEKSIRILLVVGVALLIAFTFSIYAFMIGYYEQHKYAIYVKRIFGYSYIRCNWHALVFIRCNWHVLALGIILTLLVLWPFPLTWSIIGVAVVIDVLLTIVFNNVIGAKSFSEIIKGVH